MSVEFVGQVLSAILAGVTLLGVLIRFLVLLPLKAYIKEQTYPIQPNANGGRSLPDVVLGIEAIKYRIQRLEERLDRLDTPNK